MRQLWKRPRPWCLAVTSFLRGGVGRSCQALHVPSHGDPISPPTSPMNTGTVKWFDRKKGFGFAAPDAGGDDIFLHQLNLQNDSEGKRPFVNEGDALSYDIGEYNGRPSALNTTMLSTQTRLPRHRRRQAETAIQPEAPVVSTASGVSTSVPHLPVCEI